MKDLSSKNRPYLCEIKISDEKKPQEGVVPESFWILFDDQIPLTSEDILS
jgi:hypothetical protein